jgi:hypothetical protein
MPLIYHLFINSTDYGTIVFLAVAWNNMKFLGDERVADSGLRGQEDPN